MTRTFLVVLVLSLALVATAAARPGDDKSGTKTMVGCLSGPNAEGQFTLQAGKGKEFQISSSQDLKPHVGHKVKVTGTWEKAEASADASSTEKKEHQHGGKHLKVSNIEHMADTCDVSALAPESVKEKQKY